jgi:hypothetical protein
VGLGDGWEQNLPNSFNEGSVEGGFTMSATDYVRSLTTEILGASVEWSQAAEKPNASQGGQHLLSRAGDGEPLDVTNCTSDQVIQPARKSSPGP